MIMMNVLKAIIVHMSRRGVALAVDDLERDVLVRRPAVDAQDARVGRAARVL